jgi:hypothetical protein
MVIKVAHTEALVVSFPEYQEESRVIWKQNKAYKWFCHLPTMT